MSVNETTHFQGGRILEREHGWIHGMAEIPDILGIQGETRHGKLTLESIGGEESQASKLDNQSFRIRQGEGGYVNVR
jgi:hypothetical protein